MFSKDLGDTIRMYLLTQDSAHLEAAQNLLDAEKVDPSVSAAAICLPGTLIMDLLPMLETNNVLSFSRSQYQPSSASLPVYDLFEVNDLIRVFPVSFPAEGASVESVDFIICRVVWVDTVSGQLVLEPEAIL